MKISFFLTSYSYFGHARLVDGRPYDRGFTQGFGFFAITARWKSRRLRRAEPANRWLVS